MTIKPRDTKQAGETSGDDDGSMDTILASIRRILNEDEAAPAEAPRDRPSEEVLILDDSMLAGSQPARPEIAKPDTVRPPETKPEVARPGVGALEAGSVDTRTIAAARPEPEAIRPEPVERREPPLSIPPVPPESASISPPASSSGFTPRLAGVASQRSRAEDSERAALEELIAARTRAATEQSFDALHAALKREEAANAPPAAPSPMLLRGGGPSLEDMVRQELRGLLSAWLDEHLPGLVEALVRSQIEKMVRRGS